MTVVLPEPLSLLGIVLGGCFIGLVVFAVMGFLGFLLAWNSEAGSWLLWLAGPVGVLAVLLGWFLLWSLA